MRLFSLWVVNKLFYPYPLCYGTRLAGGSMISGYPRPHSYFQLGFFVKCKVWVANRIIRHFIGWKGKIKGASLAFHAFSA